MAFTDYRSPNVYAMVLDYVDHPAEDQMSSVLHPLGMALFAACKNVESYSELDGHEAQNMVDDECGYIEDLFGAVYVIGQRYLTVVTSWVIRLAEHVEHDRGSSWTLPTQRHGLVSGFGPSAPGDLQTRFSVAVDSAANFFKHESEWSRPWANLTGQPARTYGVVRRLGVKESCTGNLRALADALGIRDYDDLTPLTDGLDKWRTSLLSAVRLEFRTLGLI